MWYTRAKCIASHDYSTRFVVKRIDIISRIGDKYHIGNTEKGEYSYIKALNSVGKDIKDYQTSFLF